MMTALSSTPSERSRKAHSDVLRALQPSGTQATVALALGVSESTISRTKTEKLEDSIALMYQLGFKVVSGDRVCVDRDKYEAMCTIARAAMSCPVTANRLIWDGEQ